MVRSIPEISISPCTEGWAVLIDNKQAGKPIEKREHAKATAEWLADLFETFGAPLVLGGFGENPAA